MQVFIGTPEGEEVVQFLQAEDLIAVSAFSIGEIAERGIKCMVHLLRDIGSPIVVLPENHPTSSRLKMVVSCGNSIMLDCDIQPGTHPEQDILCSTDEFHSLEILAEPGGASINGLRENLHGQIIMEKL